MESTFEQYRSVYVLLEDEQSRDIYLNRLCWLISRKDRYLRNIVSAYLPGMPVLTRSYETVIADIKSTLPADRNIVLYGAGEFAPTVLQYFEGDRRLIGFCSRTKTKQKNGYLGYPVMSPEELLSRKDLSVILSVALEKPKNEIKQVLREGRYPTDQIYEIPRIPYSLESGQYFNPDFIKLGENEVFIDAGCLNLGTSLEFMRRCKGLKKVYAFEPDPDNYRVCLERKNRRELQDAEVKLLPFGVWSERTTLYFKPGNVGASKISENGSVSVPVVPVDEAVDPADKITMIKMDIEGSELEALKGAKKTIQRDKPKLAICIYHKPEDMTDIPLYIKELVPEYKLYIRHHSNFSTETVLYAVMPEPLKKEG